MVVKKFNVRWSTFSLTFTVKLITHLSEKIIFVSIYYLAKQKPLSNVVVVMV